MVGAVVVHLADDVDGVGCGVGWDMDGGAR